MCDLRSPRDCVCVVEKARYDKLQATVEMNRHIYCFGLFGQTSVEYLHLS